MTKNCFTLLLIYKSINRCVVVFFPSYFTPDTIFLSSEYKAYNRIANVFVNKKGIDTSLSPYEDLSFSTEQRNNTQKIQTAGRIF